MVGYRHRLKLNISHNISILTVKLLYYKRNEES